MEHGIGVILYEKEADGGLAKIDERDWTPAMVASLEHVNYITVGGREYETLEGRMNLDSGKLEILVVPMRTDE
ncbi:hypothetical protein I8J29_01750 [Paenibacillus sp. MWE-103]|uniref:Uncharacterized protein n=1 Tax=Paenibacillus artemisiicola TaxID=1172618 RepID=A0ABS3W3M7_9BACL|nr:hypothetical protein [Paenibacillus artemisiicola]MBO7742902.1 hypothetical protein [Paenibacillus artemisiicola]